MSVQELRKFQTAGVQHLCMSLPRQWYSVSREFNASDARDNATIEGKKFDTIGAKRKLS